jgi:Protein of unknown function (DUF3074)
MAETVGNLLRLEPLVAITDLPFHPVLSGVQKEDQCPALQPFASAFLTQGNTFATRSLANLTRQKGTKSSEGSAASVIVLKGDVGKEFWVGRRSEHAGKPEKGDATWEEFDNGLRVNHSFNEMAYTPGVTDAVQICDWDVEVEGWTDVKLAGMFLSLDSDADHSSFRNASQPTSPVKPPSVYSSCVDGIVDIIQVVPRHLVTPGITERCI